MKYRLLLILIIWCGFTSCEKDSVESKDGFVAFVETDLDYTTRSCFQLSDGNFIICGSNVLWPAGNVSYGQTKSIMAKFSQGGDLIWQKDLSIAMYDLWKGISLPEGGFVLAGLDNMPENTNITIAKYNNNGGVVKSNRLVNNTTPGSNSRNQVDICRLSNGNIAMVLIGIEPGVVGSSPRLLIFDQNLEIVVDKKFSSLYSVVKNYKNQKIVEGNNGLIYICGTTQEFNAWSWTFLMGIDGTTLDPSFFTEKIGGDTNSYPGPLIVSDEGHVIFPSAEQYKAGIYFNESNYFYYHIDEYFSVGRSVSAVETDAAGSFISRHKYSGFPAYGTLTGITKTKDGGFLLVGTCNLAADAILYSQFQILLVKTNSRLEQQWMKQINTIYPAIGVDVESTDDGGFLIGAYEKSFSQNYKMMLIKTDANGGI